MKRTWITVKRGILEPKHRAALGELIWLFIYILDLTNWEEGVIYDWLDRGAAEEMEMSIATLRDQRRKLEKKGYISCEQKQHGIRIVVHNWTNPREYTGKVYNQKIPSDTPSYTPSDTASFNDSSQNNVPSYSQKSKIKNQEDVPAKSAGKPTYYQSCDDDGLDLTPQQELKLKQKHPAYVAYYHVTKKRPKNELIDMIIEKIGDTPDQSNLEACRLEWLSRGYNPMSLKWLDWYTSGIPGYQKQNASNPEMEAMIERGKAI